MPSGWHTCRGLLEPTLQTHDALECRIRHRPFGERRDRHDAVDERQNLSAPLVDPERELHLVEPHVVEVLQQREDRLRVQAEPRSAYYDA